MKSCRLPDNFDQLFGVNKVCEAFDISQTTLDRHIATGKFPNEDHRFGRIRKWKRSTIEDVRDGRWMPGRISCKASLG